MKTKTILEKIRFACKVVRNLDSTIITGNWGIYYDTEKKKYVSNGCCFCPMAALALVYQPKPKPGREHYLVDVGKVVGWSAEEVGAFISMFDWKSVMPDYPQQQEVAKKLRADFDAGRL